MEPKDVIQQVKEDYKYDLNSLLGGLPDEALKEFLEAGIFSKVAKSTVRAGRNPQPVSRSINENRTKKEDVKKIKSPRDFFSKF